MNIADFKYPTYYVQTLGCQMNVHDSERIAGVLESMGFTLTTEDKALKGEVGVFAINTCAVRENAANKLYGHLGQLAEHKRSNPQMVIAVGGCLAQKDKDEMVKRARVVDVVFGTHNLQSLPRLIEAAIDTNTAQVEILPHLAMFPSELAVHRGSKTSAWVSISMGCNNTCTFCIVPHLRGRERDRKADDIYNECLECVKNGAKEITLLGQNVNSYGIETGDRGAFAKLLRRIGSLESKGLRRLRFTSPHPAAFTDDVIEAMKDVPIVMPNIHMPLQSGSDRILRLMRRSYNSKRFLQILDKVRAAVPDIAITTDIIVGFPDETEEDFDATLDIVSKSQFSSAFTFQYSIRPGTVAATMANQIPKEVVQKRFERLVELQNDITYKQQLKLVGQTFEVMITGTTGRKDNEDGRISGYTPQLRLVHIDCEDANIYNEGDFVQVKITYAAPHHLIGEVVG